MVEENSSSGYVSFADVRAEWQEITLVSERSHAVLYKAKRLGRWFVLKTLPSSLSQNTASLLTQQREFQFGFLLQHPNIAETYALEDVSGVGLCIVEEYVDGVQLDEWLATKPSFASRKRVWLQLQDVMAYLHAHQVTHNDLKSANIMVTRNGQNVKLIDFGLGNSDDTAFLQNTNDEDEIRLKRIGKLLFPKVISRFYCQHPKVIRSFLWVVIFMFFVGTISVIYWMLHQAQLKHQEAEKVAQMTIQKVEKTAEEVVRRTKEEQQPIVEEVKSAKFEIQTVKEYNQKKIREEEVATLVKVNAVRCNKMIYQVLNECVSIQESTDKLIAVSNYAYEVRDSIAELCGDDEVLKQFVKDSWEKEFKLY